jgi:CRISPR-associated protein Csd1
MFCTFRAQKLCIFSCLVTTNKINGINKALSSFERHVNEKERSGNIAFRIANDDSRLHEKQEIYKAIIDKYDQQRKKKLISDSQKKCSVCGKNNHPVEDVPHGMIKRVPDGQTSGCALVSFNDTAYESYNLTGNLNSQICTACARTYVEGLNWLMNNGSSQIVKNKSGKEKEVFKYSNRRNFGTDTAMVYWTRDNQKVSDLDLFDNPDPGTVAHLIESVASGEVKKSKHIGLDWFYSCTLSGAAARIAVRDWIEMSLVDLKKAIARWFEDIKIEAWGEAYYPSLYRLANCAQNEKSDNKTTTSRIATHLWKSSLKETMPPLWILTAILKRVRIIENTEDGGNKESITPDRAALIRFIINRNNKGGSMLNEQLDTENCSPPYICGRIFAVLESIQRAALGKDINAGIRERFFTFASTNPSSAFGRLMKLSQNHLTKLKNEKAGLAVILDRELQELFSKIQEFPAIFALEEQGQFAIGYYHQKQDTWKKAKSNAELKAATEESEKVTKN